MGTGLTSTIPFNTQRSIRNAFKTAMGSSQWVFVSDGKRFMWSNRMERVAVIRNGILYESIELTNERLS
jgi:hypothetical protein